MDNPQYIEYLNTFGAEINVKSQPRKEIDALFKEHITKEKGFKIFGRLFKQVIHHIRYKYYQCCDLIKKISLGNAEIERERTKLIDSIEKLRNKDLFQ